MRAIFKNNQLHPGNKPKNGKNFKLLAIVAKINQIRNKFHERCVRTVL